jgi:hypothetical protein
LLGEKHLGHAATREAPQQHVLAELDSAVGQLVRIVPGVTASLLLAMTAVMAGCTDAVELSITSDRGSGELDAVCVGVADTALHGGHFGRDYELAKVGRLPQTLRVDAGGAASAWSWVRGDRGGVPTARATAPIDFDGNVTLALPRCVTGHAGEPAQVGDAVGPGSARLVASQGQGGAVVVALGAGSAAVVVAEHGALVALPAPALTGTVVDAAAIDVDGDCQDDVVIALAGLPPELWRRDGVAFVDAGPVAALAVADVNADGALDLVVGQADTLAVLANDGAGDFTALPGAIDAGSALVQVSALATGDIDGNGTPDLVVGQSGSGAIAAWSGQPGGGFLAAPGIVPPLPIDVARLYLVDADGDLAPDLEIAASGAPWRLFIDRAGVLEDQSFVRLPQPAPVAGAIAVGGWDTGCEPDAVVATATGSPGLTGQADGTFADDGSIPPASDVVLVDIDDDGALDAVLAGSDGVIWVARR